MTCRKCGREVPQSAGGRGRPRSYCSTGCRRAMEYELRRLQKGLEAIEEQLTWCRLGWNGRKPGVAHRYDQERVRLEGRMRVLLDEPDPPGP